MKRILIAAVLLIICVSTSAHAMQRTREVNDYIAGSVARSLDALSQGEESSLSAEIEALSDYWEGEEDRLIHLIRHAQIDDITKGVSRLRALTAGEDYSELAAELESIRWQMAHINRSERLIFQNLL